MNHLPDSLSPYNFLIFLGREGQVVAMQSCARCGFVVYPAEKINCIDQVTYKFASAFIIFMWHIQIGNEFMFKMVCTKSCLQSFDIYQRHSI